MSQFDELDKLMEPFFNALTKAEREVGQAIYRTDKAGVLAWGVRSGYFLWVREHPGEIPTDEHIALWTLIGKAKKQRESYASPD